MDNYRGKYEVFRWLEDQAVKQPEKFFSVKEIARGLGVGENGSYYWSTRHVRNAVISLISEGMVYTTVTKKMADWRILVKAVPTRRESVPIALQGQEDDEEV